MNTNTTDFESLSLSNPETERGWKSKLGLGLGFLGLFILLLAFFEINLPSQPLFLTISLLSIAAGIVFYTLDLYKNHPAGIKNNGVWLKDFTNGGTWAWILGVVLTIFYVLLYWFPETVGQGGSGKANSGLVALFDPLSQLLKNQPASQWFVYGVLYTLAILGLGIKFIYKYRHNKYQIVRTISVMFFQLGFAFLLPEFLLRLNQPFNDFKNMWPLNYYFFDEWHLKELINSGGVGIFMLVFGIAMVFIISPILTYFYGKRWYCSWVCGCGGLAETAGDPFRQLSNKKLSAWKFERWLIHAVLVFSVLMTIAVIFTFLTRNPELSIITRDQFTWGISIFLLLVAGVIYLFKKDGFDKNIRNIILSIVVIIVGVLLINTFSDAKNIFFIESYKLRSWYGFAVGSAFSGVIGVGFYPLLGNRVWCRFGCPMAAILGLQQRLFSRFRITTNGGQCISCGNCSTYCEMGIDVRSYAQRGENIVRSSCVGCGICSAVCPRGVLKLENGSLENRINSDAVLLGNDVDLLSLIRNQKSA
ncbi:MAG: 4Fe-4S binding protein [Flavobacteriaceae bacterium]|nr:4Fe-4S binding protein [Flavobacteriaceae bacterium]